MLAKTDSPSRTVVDLICREIRKIRAELEAIECDVVPHDEGRTETLIDAENNAWERLAATPSENIDDLVMKAGHCQTLAEEEQSGAAYIADGLVAPLCASVSNDVVRLKVGLWAV